MNQMVFEQKNGHIALALILEPGNIQRMKEGLPVLKHVRDFFPAGIPANLDVLIFFSETPVADAKDFAKSTKMFVDERTPVAQKKKPHCSECKSTVEQLAIWRNESMLALLFCPQCGCVFGSVPSEVVKAMTTGTP